MKTKTIFLIVSLTMLILEAILGILAFGFINDWMTELALIAMMAIGVLIITIMFNMYKDEKDYEKIKIKF